jgi:hypothetical protein
VVHEVSPAKVQNNREYSVVPKVVEPKEGKVECNGGRQNFGPPGPVPGLTGIVSAP